jgi:hypothetical protein
MSRRSEKLGRKAMTAEQQIKEKFLAKGMCIFWSDNVDWEDEKTESEALAEEGKIEIYWCLLSEDDDELWSGPKDLFQKHYTLEPCEGEDYAGLFWCEDLSEEPVFLSIHYSISKDWIKTLQLEGGAPVTIKLKAEGAISRMTIQVEISDFWEHPELGKWSPAEIAFLLHLEQKQALREFELKGQVSEASVVRMLETGLVLHAEGSYALQDKGREVLGCITRMTGFREIGGMFSRLAAHKDPLGEATP